LLVDLDVEAPDLADQLLVSRGLRVTGGEHVQQMVPQARQADWRVIDAGVAPRDGDGVAAVRESKDTTAPHPSEGRLQAGARLLEPDVLAPRIVGAGVNRRRRAFRSSVIPVRATRRGQPRRGIRPSGAGGGDGVPESQSRR